MFPYFFLVFLSLIYVNKHTSTKKPVKNIFDLNKKSHEFCHPCTILIRTPRLNRGILGSAAIARMPVTQNLQVPYGSQNHILVRNLPRIPNSPSKKFKK